MFGYVTIYKDELKVREYQDFRAYYCGLCKAIGKKASQIARMGLSYDMTFLALVLDSVSETKPIVSQEGCFVHPLRKQKTIKNNPILDYVAYMSVLLVYLKFEDDWKDEKSIKALLAMGAYQFAYIKAKREYPEQYKLIKKYLNKLSEYEKNKNKEIDEVADCFANILKVLFTPSFVKDEDTRRILEWFGYNTGRWIYLIDAVHDVEKDIKTKGYNPILYYIPIKENQSIEDYSDYIKNELEITLTFTLNNIASSYELLSIHRNDELLKNILYLGLRNKQDIILKTTKEDLNESV